VNPLGMLSGELAALKKLGAAIEAVVGKAE
jgi:hypothetical protein